MSSAFGLGKVKVGLFRPILDFGVWSKPDQNACFDFCAQRQAKLMCQCHTTYRKNNNLEKCTGMGVNGFHIKWIIGTHCNWKNQNPGSLLGATS